MNMDQNMLLGDLVALYPKAAGVLKSYRIDFCCNGNRSLLEAIKEQGCNEQEIIGKLNEVCINSADNEEVNWLESSYSELIDHIINNHHQYIYTTLPGLAQYVQTVENVHGEHHEELHELRRLFADLHKDLMQHLPKEEQDTFPAIKRFEQEPTADNLAECKQIIDTLEDEHETCGTLLKEIRKVTKDYELPSDACATYQLTYRMLEDLEADLFQHIHLENNILFPRVMNARAG